MRKPSFKKTQFITAFTLIELSVVILIIAILLFGTVSSSSVITAIKNRITKERMEIIYGTMGNFLYQNKRLPCPASINLSKTDFDNYGKEVRDSSTAECSGFGIYSPTQSTNQEFLTYGMVPTKTLNISADFAEDGFGNKFSFYIDKRYAKDYIANISSDIFLAVPSFGTAQSKDLIYIKNRVPSGELTVNNDAIIVILSHGANGFGAFKNNGFQNTIAGDNQEFSNIASNFVGSSATFDRVFYSTSETGDDFDDILLFKTRDDFVKTFDVMSIIPCKGNDIKDEDFTKVSSYYGNQIYALVSCPIPFESIKKIKKCDNFGRWIDVVSSCPDQSAVINCTLTGTGIKSKTVPSNTQGNDGECAQNYAGSYSWSCSSTGVGLVTSNNCNPYCTISGTGTITVNAPPNQDGEGGCSTGYNGYFTWSCNSTGVGTIIANNCNAN